MTLQDEIIPIASEWYIYYNDDGDEMHVPVHRRHKLTRQLDEWSECNGYWQPFYDDDVDECET